MAKTSKQAPKDKTETTPRRYQLKKLAVLLADSPLPAIAFITTFILSRWWVNSDFSYPKEVIAPIALFAVLIAVIYYGYRWVLKQGLAPHIATIILSWCLYSYSHLLGTSTGQWFVQLLPDKWQTDFNKSIFIGTLLVLAAGAVGWGVGKLVNRYRAIQNLQPYKVLMFALVFIFIVQLGRTGLRLLEINSQLSYRPPAPSLAKPKNQPASKPDIYYLVFDRYGNQPALQENFNFDNAELYNFLNNHGFNNRPTAYANYPFTMSSIASTMAMDYFPQFEKMFATSGDWQSAAPYRSILNNPPIAQILKQNGYSYNQISSWWDFTRVGIKADGEPTKSFRLRTLGTNYFLSDIQRDIINKSVLAPWLKKGLSLGSWPVAKYDLTRNPQQNFESQMSALKNLAARPDKSQPQFSFAHVLVPHDPYIFTADGSTPTYDNNRTDNGVDETVKYTNQTTYLNKRLRELISYMRANSPEAVIIIQADEGPYPKEFRFKLEPGHYYDPAQLRTAKMKQKFSTLASYYLPGVGAGEQPVQANVDIFRYVLNRYLGYNLTMLPDCHLSSGDKFTIYSYQEISDKLTGQSTPKACAQYDPVKN